MYPVFALDKLVAELHRLSVSPELGDKPLLFYDPVDSGHVVRRLLPLELWLLQGGQKGEYDAALQSGIAEEQLILWALQSS